jgi:hypothetical protein
MHTCVCYIMCTYMCTTNLYIYVHVPVYYNACGKSFFRHLMLLYGCLAVTEQMNLYWKILLFDVLNINSQTCLM